MYTLTKCINVIKMCYFLYFDKKPQISPFLWKEPYNYSINCINIPWPMIRILDNQLKNVSKSDFQYGFDLEGQSDTDPADPDPD